MWLCERTLAKSDQSFRIIFQSWELLDIRLIELKFVFAFAELCSFIVTCFRMCKGTFPFDFAEDGRSKEVFLFSAKTN